MTVNLNYPFCFQGVMVKYKIGGGPASHGNSKAHRTMGSTGILGLGRVG
jgi:large subunit ribosomal protein L3